MKKILVLLLLGVCSAAFSQGPNIILIMADDVSWECFGSYGAEDYQTPNIDALANEGLMLTQHLVEPGCTPSRAALLTGRYSIRSGLSLIVIRGAGNTLEAREVTIAEALKERGYDTAMYGKWHIGMEAQSQPQNQGFDEWYGILNSSDEALYAPLLRQAQVPGADKIKIDIVQSKGSTELEAVKPYNLDARREIDLELTEKAENYIAKASKSSSPFFLYLSWTRPHFPNTPSPAFEGKSRIGDYGDSVMELDDNVGRVMQAVKKAGIADNTILVFASDNGPMRSVLLPHDAGWAGMYRGELGTPYEGSLRTPAIISWPGKITAARSNEMVSIMDWAPTFASMAGGAMPDDRPIDGIDMSDFLLGKSATSGRDHLLSFIGKHLVAARYRQFRVYFKDFVEIGGAHRQGGSSSQIINRIYPSVYNIEADPREERDISVYQAGLNSAVTPILHQYFGSLAQHPNPPAANMTDY